jgi:hypothetical protein
MYTQFIRLVARPGKRDDLAKLLEILVEEAKHEPGIGIYRMELLAGK